MPDAYVPVKLSIQAASREFGVSRSSLKEKLSDLKPDSTGCYSIAQVLSVLYTDLAALKAAEIKERTRHWQIKNQTATGVLLDRSALESELYQVSVAVRKSLDGSGVPASTQKRILDKVNGIFTMLDTVAASQSNALKVYATDAADKAGSPDKGDTNE